MHSEHITCHHLNLRATEFIPWTVHKQTPTETGANKMENFVLSSALEAVQPHTPTSQFSTMGVSRSPTISYSSLCRTCPYRALWNRMVAIKYRSSHKYCFNEPPHPSLLMMTVAFPVWEHMWPPGGPVRPTQNYSKHLRFLNHPGLPLNMPSSPFSHLSWPLITVSLSLPTSCMVL